LARFLAVALVGMVLVVGGLSCGGGDDEGTDTTTTETTTTDETTTETAAAAGRDVFVANCGSCHALSDAGTSGTVGPNLDGSGLSVDQIEQQVRNGGGAMPPFAGQLDDAEIAAVAEYVAAQG
jgi:mono/diheme cytochrome c family protein